VAQTRRPKVPFIVPRSEIEGLSSTEIARLLDLIGDQEQQRLSLTLNIKVRSRAVRGGIGKLCKVQLRRVDRRDATAAMFGLTRPVLAACIAALGNHSDNPTADQLRAVTPELVDRFGLAAVRIMYLFAIDGEAPARAALEELLDTDPILQPPEPEPPEEDENEVTPVAAALSEDSQPASAPDEELSSEETVEEERPEDDAATFTALDHILISTLVSSANEVYGAPTLDDVSSAVAEFVALNVDRHASLFHAGFLEGMTGRQAHIPADGQNDSRRQYELFGRLCGYIRRDAGAQLIADATKSLDLTASVLDDRNHGYTVTTPLVLAALAHDPQRVPWIVAHRHAPFRNMGQAFREVRRHGRSLLLGGHAKDAEEVFHALEGWADLTSAPGAARVDIARRIAACRRAERDWPGASAALDVVRGMDQMPPEVRALIVAEEGLIAAQVPSIAALRFPDGDGYSTAEMLRQGEPMFAEALSLDPHQMHAALCLGLLAWCDGRNGDAAALLDVALAGIGSDDLLDTTRLAVEVRLHAAVAALIDGDVSDGGDIVDAVEAAIEVERLPTVSVLEVAVQGLATLESPHFPRLVEAVAAARPAAVLGTLDELAASAIAGRSGCAAAARNVGGLPQVEPRARLELLTAAAEGYLLHAETDAFSGAIEDIEDLLGQMLLNDLDDAWAETLGSSHLIREAIGGTVATLTQIHLWRRSGNIERAAAELTSLCYRAAAGELPGYNVEDLVGLLGEMGLDEEHLAPLRSLGGTEIRPEKGRSNPVRVMFIGGNEVQERYDASIEDAVNAIAGERVAVHWLHSGWDSNWSIWADRAASMYPKVDIVVLMPFMRTNLGMRLRREIGEAGLQWRACTGHGKASIQNAILEAVAVADAAGAVK
jgi:hypothetical protein